MSGSITGPTGGDTARRADAETCRRLPQDPTLDDRGRATLHELALDAVRVGLETGRRPRIVHDDRLGSLLAEPGASFVTLRRRGALLGCIGSIEPHRPLADDVADNAWSAAFADPRLPAVTWDDLPELEVKISVLTPLVPLEVHDLAELTDRVVPGVDGLLIEAGRHRGTFLPSVWTQVPEPGRFLDLLWHKAGLTPRTWRADLRVWRYRTEEF